MTESAINLFAGKGIQISGVEGATEAWAKAGTSVRSRNRHAGAALMGICLWVKARLCPRAFGVDVTPRIGAAWATLSDTTCGRETA